ncbi:MAG: LemA family protein [Flavobacteriales bacterium]
MKWAVLIFLGTLLLSVVIFYFYAASVRDNAVGTQETVNEAWSNVQSSYQRRAALILNLVETVRASAENEKQILVGVTEARAGIAHYTDSLGRIITAQRDAMRNAKSPQELEGGDMMIMNSYKGFRGFMTENYPTVQSTQNFTVLQEQLEGTENRINTERNRYNEAVKEYNTMIRGTWRKMALKWVSETEDAFQVKEAFQAKEGSDEAPKVKF